MKVRHSIVMVFYILPDRHGMVMFTVKGTVYKFHLGYLVIQEKLQFFFFYQGKIPEPQFLINRGQTIAAGKRTPPAAFIINDPITKSSRFS